MIASVQIANTEIFAFIAILGFELLSLKFLCYKHERQYKLLKERLLFRKIADFTGRYFNLHDCTFK